MLLSTNHVNMKESKFWKRVRSSIIKIVTMLFLSTCTVNISAESEVAMISNSSESTLTYTQKDSLNVSLETDSPLPYLHETNFYI